MLKRMLIAGAAMTMILATPVVAQECDDELISCDDGGGLGGGGLGGVGGGTVPGKGGAVTPTPAAAPTANTTINFNTVGATLGSYAEGGYTFNTLSGTILGGYGAYGSRGIGVLGPLAAVYNPAAPANIFELTRTDGGLFNINSFFSVIAGPAGTNIVGIDGYFNGALIGSSTVSQTDVFGFGFPQASGLAQTFDRAVFTLSTSSSSSSFDNLALTAVAATPAVPEPATWAMMLVGFGAVGFAMRSAKRRSDAKFDYKIKRIAAGLEA